MKNVVIFIPCLNEIDGIESLVDDLRIFSKKSRKFTYKILVVDDGSTDGLNKIYSKLRIDYYYRNKLNLGLGAATRIGMECAHYIGGDIFIKFDADLQHRISDIEKIALKMDELDLDIVYGSRFAGKINYKMPIYRKLGNYFFTKLMKVLTNWKITDAQTGLMCFSRNYLTVFEMPSTYNPPQQALMDGKSKKMLYGEIAVEFDKRKHGKSFISIKYIYKVFSALLKLIFVYHSYRILVGSGLVLLMFSAVDILLKIRYGTGIMSDFYISFVNRNLLFTIISVNFFITGLQTFAILNRNIINRNNGNYIYMNRESLIKVSNID